MDATDRDELPDVAEVFARVLADVPRQQQPLLVAVAERMAAARYREWAREIRNAQHAEKLRACADREEEIAARIEALYPDAEAQLRELRSRGPDLEQITRAVFAGRPLADQLTLQARGERLGAATWRSFADAGDDRATLMACAELEEASAAVLEEILASGI